jgi:hypothetical protein
MVRRLIALDATPPKRDIVEVPLSAADSVALIAVSVSLAATVAVRIPAVN